jgi:hypothetical protein
VTKNNPPPTHLKSLTSFRQQVYELFDNQRDVLFEIMDAVIQTPAARSYAELSLAAAFTRKWPSLYDGLAKGKVDVEQARALCLAQLPRERSRLHFSLDVMAVRRMSSPTLNDRLFCHAAQREVGGQGVIIGLPYSILAYADERGTSWTPAVHTERVKPGQTAVEVALAQSRWLVEQLPAQTSAEIALDGSYGNFNFLMGLTGVKAFTTARLRNDRVLYQPLPAPEPGKKSFGRPRKYGPVFRFSDPNSWPQPDESLELEDAAYGRLRLELWKELILLKQRQTVKISVLRSQIHLEKDQPPAAHWYGVHNETPEPTSLARAFECLAHRWPIEPANRFRKERLYAELPKVRRAEASDLWLNLLQLIEWQLQLWRPIAKDCHLPWQKPLPVEKLTPGRVIRSLAESLSIVGSPVAEVLPRGKSPGWPRGRVRTALVTYELETKKQKKALAMSKSE